MNQKMNNVLHEMSKRGMDALIISDPSSIDYLIGYHNQPGERLFALILTLDGHHTLMMNKLFYLDRDLDVDIVWYSDTDDYVSLIADCLEDACCIGVDKLFPAKWLLPLMGQTHDEAYFEIGSICVDYVRMKKDDEEIAIMKEASRINDLAMDQVVQLVSQGTMSEKEIEQELAKIYASYGASGFSFSPIIAYGANGADGHHRCDQSLIHEGDSVVIDMGCVYKGYCSDMTRTIFYKDISDKQRSVYELVKKANAAAEAMIKPGVKLCDIDKTARDIIAQGGYVAEFNHRLGHFIGRDVHEYGDVSQGFDLPVEPGMIFSIEPGVYIQGEFGVRIEDLVLVTEDGCEILNSYTKELMVKG